MTPKDITVRQLKYHWEVYLLVVPTLLLIGIFSYFPAASGVYHSLFRWNGADIAEWVGGRNYLDLVKSAAFWDSFKVALLLGFWNIIKMLPALGVAVAIHRCRSERMQFLYRIMFVVPMVIPALVTVLIWRSFFFESTSGYLNQFLLGTHLMGVFTRLDTAFGWGGAFVAGQMPSWLGDSRLIFTSCIIWGFPWVGSFAVLTHLAKLQNIPKSVYEAADIDGVSWWTKFTRVELPMMMGSIYILLVFVIIDTIRDAGSILALAGMEGGPGGVVTVPALFMFREAFVNQNMGYACAVGIVLTVVVMGLHQASSRALAWATLTPAERFRLRAAVGGAGVLLVVLQAAGFGSLGFIGGLLVLAALPWPWLRDRIRPPHPVAARVRQANATRSWSPPPPALTTHAGQDRLLRLAKHGSIWFVLAMAFLPVYLMAIVCLKSNQQFYEFPARLVSPYHWENIRLAWEAIAPSLANSFFICTSATLATLATAVCAAYFFSRVKVPLSGFFWNAILVLMMLPAIANLVPLFRLLRDLGMLNTLSALILVSAAGGQVVAIFVLRNFVADIPQEMFDAAEVDGASHFQQIRTIVIPQAGPILGTVGVMHFIAEWNNFVLPLILMRDHDRLPVMVQLLRMSGEYIKYWGPLMAGYTLASLPIVVLFVFTMRLFMKGLAEAGTTG